MGPGAHQSLHEQEGAVRGEIGGGVDCGLTQGRHLALCRVHHHQLGGGVVLEEGIVVGGLEQVAGLVGGTGFGPCPLEDLGPRRDGRRLGRRSTLRDATDQEALLVGQPAHSGAEELVDGHILDLGQVALHRAHPQAHMVGVPGGEGEALAVRGPGHCVDLCVFGQIEGRLGAALDLDEARGGGPVAPVDVVDHRIHPHAGQHVHGRRQLGEWWIGDGIGQQQVLTRGCGPHPGELGSVEDLHHLLGGSLPLGFRLLGVVCCLGDRRHRQRHGGEHGQDSKHDPPPRFVACCSKPPRSTPVLGLVPVESLPTSICDDNNLQRTRGESQRSAAYLRATREWPPWRLERR